MHAYIPNKEELRQFIREAVKEAQTESLPDAIRKATQREWLTTDDVMEILQCSRRHVQHLRDKGLLSYTQNNRTVRYHIDDVEAYLNAGKVSGRQR